MSTGTTSSPPLRMRERRRAASEKEAWNDVNADSSPPALDASCSSPRGVGGRVVVDADAGRGAKAPNTLPLTLATLLWRLTKDSFTETSKTTVRGDADDAAFVTRALAGIHRAFAAVSHEDDHLPPAVATRLLLLLEFKGARYRRWRRWRCRGGHGGRGGGAGSRRGERSG